MEQARGLRLQHLDMLRGLCALGVVVSHVRALLLVLYEQAERHGLGATLLFVVGGLGHECVIVFFALSGYLVGGSALAAISAGRFSWLDYGAARLSRLWTVLLPALVLTAALDWVGAALAPPGAYEGALATTIASGPTPSQPADHSVTTFLGNLFFLQTVATPVFGSNRPLWSLANEAWYYLAFPLLAFGLLRSSGVARVLYLGAGLLMLTRLPGEMVLLGVPWIAGALASAYPARRAPARALVAAAAAIGAVGFAHASHSVGGDIVLGCVVAVSLRYLAALDPLGGLYARAASGLSSISYTLYAVHFPFLLMLWFWLFAPTQAQPGVRVVAEMAAFVAVALIYAAGVWFLFERRTGAVRDFMTRLAGLAPTAARIPGSPPG